MSAAISASPSPALNTMAGPNHAEFSTDVDTLMRAIQAKGEKDCGGGGHKDDKEQIQLPQAPFPFGQVGLNEASPKAPGLMGYTQQEARTKGRKYRCTIPACDKIFYQKTHLEIHVRSHTGEKPYVSRPHQARRAALTRNRPAGLLTAG